MSSSYGKPPERIGVYDLEFVEYMHYMYLPILIPEQSGLMVPKRLRFALELILDAIDVEHREKGNRWTHVYVTARRGYATPGNPLNRPGWHADGFGTTDINYVWTDRYPTWYAVQPFDSISDGHESSVRDFERQIRPENVVTYEDKVLQRLDPYVIHAAPEIPAPGGERSFFKVSFSNDRYNLRGNSHNYLFDYDWPMFDRAATRNDPARQDADGVAS